VSRIFEMAAEGSSLLAVKKALERDGVPTVTGKRLWNIKTLQRIVNNDAHRANAVTTPGLALPGAAGRRRLRVRSPEVEERYHCKR
jgi:hypothetical protein